MTRKNGKRHAEKRPCPACGGTMVRDSRPDTVSYKHLTAKVTQPGWYCDSCDEALLEAAYARATEPVFMDLKARADGVLTAREVTRIRKRLGLSQRAAGEILGGGPRAFQKYEARGVVVSKPMSNLLRLLDHHPEALKQLKRA